MLCSKTNPHYEDFIVRRLFFVNKMREIIGDRSLRAWDYGRSISLCRWGYEVGYLTEKEAWDRIFKISPKIEALYCSWEDYAAGYIIGRMFWFVSDDLDIKKGNEISKAYSKLINRQDSVWILPWNIAGKALKKYRPVTIAECNCKRYLPVCRKNDG